MAELFERVEVNRAPRWPLMTRLLALSVVVHGVFLVAVVYVPTLRSMLALASALTRLSVGARTDVTPSRERSPPPIDI